MSGVLDAVNQRTQLVGKNRLELLTFRLEGRQCYGINVFKVREVLPCPGLTVVPNSHRDIKGFAHIRGQTLPVIDLSKSIGGKPIKDPKTAFVIITEFNRMVQAFLVESVDRIINMNWESVLLPPKGSGRSNYLTAVTEFDNQLIEILDVETIISNIFPKKENLSSEIKTNLIEKAKPADDNRKVLIVDDSTVARRQIKHTIESLGYECLVVEDGRKAFELLKSMAKEGPIYAQISVIISDIEMPEMDGYTLSAEIRASTQLNELFIILHTSLSGVFNQAMIERVGANQFLPKFNPDELGLAVTKAVMSSRNE